jgi:hypothetical protein
MGKTFIA